MDKIRRLRRAKEGVFNGFREESENEDKNAHFVFIFFLFRAAASPQFCPFMFRPCGAPAGHSMAACPVQRPPLLGVSASAALRRSVRQTPLSRVDSGILGVEEDVTAELPTPRRDSVTSGTQKIVQNKALGAGAQHAAGRSEGAG